MFSVLLRALFKIIALLLILDQTEFFSVQFLKTTTGSFDKSLLSESAVVAGSREIFRITQVSSVISVTFMPVGKTTFILVTLTLVKISTLNKYIAVIVNVRICHGVVVK
jgi:hypothetical protein